MRIPSLAFAAFVVVSVVCSPFASQAAEWDNGWWWHDNTPEIVPSGPPTDLVFPVQGGAAFSDDFSDARSGGRQHEGNDLMAPKMTPILAAKGGRVTFAPTTQPSYGYMISIRGEDGYKYNYLHINNDTPGTDDGQGGVTHAYAPGIQDGVTVTQGQHIAWVGDSGNAESTGPHLHFEIRQSDDTAINPYAYLLAIARRYSFDPAAAKAASPTIDADKRLAADPFTPASCTAGSLIRLADSTSVYYCGSDGKRYVFPNARTYATWYANFSTVQVIAPEVMGSIRLGGNVTYRPGVKLVKITTDPKVYAVDLGGTLRWVASPAVAAKHYGASWAKQVEDVPDTFFMDYKIGDPINE